MTRLLRIAHELSLWAIFLFIIEAAWLFSPDTGLIATVFITAYITYKLLSHSQKRASAKATSRRPSSPPRTCSGLVGDLHLDNPPDPE